ncbi:uncharacterized protein LOC122021459 isoform X1 [Zingiber officinale]|uniref:uncharacterized protein LOC122021459 isoform X1 n=1 Tax=Zingiber officinale TaxID=94328 RepID=UPI001C4C76B6|nr:uncharacterized protein LOC122021459 isoform X1 [Zingiber officinale]
MTTNTIQFQSGSGNRIDMEKAAAALVLLAVAMGATASGVKDQQCAANLLPCSQYLNATGKPPESCCRVFRNEVENELSCLCAILHNSAILKSFNMNSTRASQFASDCGVTNTSICASSGPMPPPAPLPLAPSERLGKSHRYGESSGGAGAAGGSDGGDGIRSERPAVRGESAALLAVPQRHRQAAGVLLQGVPQRGGKRTVLPLRHPTQLGHLEILPHEQHQGLPVRQRLRRHQHEHLRLFRSDASSSAITTRSFSSFRRDYLFQELHRAAGLDELAFVLVDRRRVKLL